MLFTYAKLWVLVVVKAIWDSAGDAIFHREVKWDKTVRYAENATDENPDISSIGGRT